MPCHVPATSVSSHRRKPFSKRPSIIAAKFDMRRPGERWAQSFMIWAATGARPAWKPMAVARREDAIVVAVEWGTWPHDERPYGVVEIALSGDSLRWQSFQIGEKEPTNSVLSLHDGTAALDSSTSPLNAMLSAHTFRQKSKSFSVTTRHEAYRSTSNGVVQVRPPLTFSGTGEAGSNCNAVGRPSIPAALQLSSSSTPSAIFSPWHER